MNFDSTSSDFPKSDFSIVQSKRRKSTSPSPSPSGEEGAGPRPISRKQARKIKKSKFEVFIGTSDQLPAEFEVVDSISSPGSVESSEHSQSA